MCDFLDWLYTGRWHLQIREWGKGLFGPEIPEMGKRQWPANGYHDCENLNKHIFPRSEYPKGYILRGF